MRYSKPELVVLGPVSIVVLGIPDGELDNVNPDFERPDPGVALGLDD